MKTTDYRPVPCETYAQYELWILRGARLRLAWHGDQGQAHLITALPVDLETRAHEEFLVARAPGGQCLRIRLDRIVRAEAL